MTTLFVPRLFQDGGRSWMALLFFQIILISVSPSNGGNTLIGCYKDQVSDPDMTYSINYTPETFELDKCATECRKKGYPYLGVQEQKRCYCGMTYGKHGTGGDECNYTCGVGTEKIGCGGAMASDVYYSLDNNVERLNVVQATPMNFDDARGSCVMNNGDILAFTSASALTPLLGDLEDNNLETGLIWQGLRKIDGSYKWTNASSTANLDSSNWKSDDTQANDCVIVNVAGGKWQTTLCALKAPFVCYQAPDTADSTDDEVNNGSSTTEDDSGGIDTSMLSLCIVLPVFGLCYGGSCVLYCAHKIYKAFKRKKRQKMLLSRMEDMSDGNATPTMEYEPHNKPKYEPQQKRPFSASKRATVHPVMGAPPPQNGYNQPPPARSSTTPVEDIRIPSPRGEPEGEQAKDDPAKEDNPETSRPDTTRDVRITMTDQENVSSPPPTVVSASTVATAAVAVDAMKQPPPNRAGSQSAKTKSEMRRQKLLDKALKEARERRRQEGTPLPDHATPQPPTPNENQWAQPTSKRKKAPLYDDDSGDSTVNLLSDNDRGRSADAGMDRDPTTMSIQEILRMKVASKRRPKKILSA